MRALEQKIEDMFDAWENDNANMLEALEALIENPDVPAKAKAKFIARAALPAFKDMRADPELMGLVKKEIQEQLQTIQAFADPAVKGEIMGLINGALISKITQIPAEGLRLKTIAKLDEMKEKNNRTPEEKQAEADRKKAKKDLNRDLARMLSDHTTQKRDVFDVDQDIAEEFAQKSLLSLGEEGYVAATTGLKTILPKHLSEFLTETHHEGQDWSVKIREEYHDKVAGKQTDTSNALVNFIPSTVMADAFVEVVGKIDGERIYQAGMEILSHVDEALMERVLDTGLDFVEAMLEAAAETGNPFMFKDGQIATDFAETIGHMTQVIEDAVMEAGLTPETDLIGVYKQNFIAKKGPKM